MPRMSDAEKQKSHKRILDAAARILRADGIEATSVGDVMQAAGMTHGGFYRHFASKEELVAAAVDRAADGVLGPVEQAARDAPQDAAEGYVAAYLSEEHRRNRDIGCPLAAIAGEALRADGPVRDAAARAAQRTARLLDGPQGDDGAGLAKLSVLLGSVLLARLVQDEDDAARILQSGRETLERLQDRPGGGEESPD